MGPVPIPTLLRAEWPAHPRYPAQTLLLESHSAFRKTSGWLIDRVRSLETQAVDARKRARWVNRVRGDFEWWMAGMRGHERYEEGKLYPYLANRFGASFAHLEAGHAVLHRYADAVSTAAREHYAGARALGAVIDALREHQDILLEHLAEEEELVIPMLLALSPDEFAHFMATPAAALLPNAR